MSIKAMEMALEALHEAVDFREGGLQKAIKAVDALRTAIQQPATSEPVWFHKHWYDGDDIFYRPGDNIPPGSVPLYARPAPDVPEGYALVPIEPTAEMLQAALKVATPGALRAAWARMLAASPAQKGGKRPTPRT